eukprot:GHRR01017303.1.p1 GENE.GHRR01017303.1~~GHRR01017303.1.p1  ORF type:complete len:106 (+),score=6.17 GHRR01017303.1:1069-1386(+)
MVSLAPTCQAPYIGNMHSMNSITQAHEVLAGVTLTVSKAPAVQLTMVPLANLSNSNTPIGPFQTTVLHSLRASWKSLMESGPMSRPCINTDQKANHEHCTKVLDL